MREDFKMQTAFPLSCIYGYTQFKKLCAKDKINIVFDTY